jgi:hypothetical protein
LEPCFMIPMKEFFRSYLKVFCSENCAAQHVV